MQNSLALVESEAVTVSRSSVVGCGFQVSADVRAKTLFTKVYLLRNGSPSHRDGLLFFHAFAGFLGCDG